MVRGIKRKRHTDVVPRKSPRIEEEDISGEELGNAHKNSDGGPEDENMSSMDEGDNTEEWGGIGAGIPVAVHSGARTGVNPKKLPTGEELRVIKDATDLFKSGSFRLQIDALLPNVRPKASRIPPLERFLFALHSFLSGLPTVSPQHPLEGARKLQKKGVAVPYSLPLPTEDTNWKVAFEPPSDITLVGSWANKVSVKAKDGKPFGVDLAVEMPNSLFQEKDYLNGRFFHKRSFYLATIAAAVKSSKSGLNVDVAYESLQDDPRLTKLVLTPKQDGSQNDFTKLNVTVCILPTLSTNSPIPLHRLSPSHSNLRVNVTSDVANVDAASSSHPPTPIYNTALLQTMTTRRQLLAVHSLKSDCATFGDALTLLRVWANQRGYGEGTRMAVRGLDKAGPWWWSLLALLLDGEETRQDAKKNKRRSVGRGLSSYQLFRAALDFIAKHDFDKSHIFVRSPEGHRFPPEEYSAHPESVFIDSASLTNLLAGVPLGSLDLLRYDASKTLEELNQTSLSGDPFTSVFLKDSRDLTTRFDVILRVNLASAKPRTTSVHNTLEVGSSSNALLASIASVLRKGLGDRSRAVTLLHPSSKARPISQAHPSSPDVIFIGIIHNPQNAFRLVDHGPAAEEQDETQLKQFRDLWGDKAELRRFKDGRIVESVVWEVTTVDERAHIPALIVKHLLHLHFNILETDAESWQTPFDAMLRLPASISKEIIAAGVPTGFKSALEAFDDLVKTIKNLGEELPLSLLTISPSSEFLRYTSVFSPVPMPKKLAGVLPSNARYLPPIEIILEFEKSTRWPDDLKAIQSIKLAFFERIASALMSSVEGLKAAVVVGDDGVVRDANGTIVDQVRMEIITPAGWAFSARIWHDRELTLLERAMGGKAVALPHIVSKAKEKKTKEYWDALAAKEVYLRRFVHAPRHHRAIAALCHRHAAYAGTVRLVKRWLAAHWVLGAHVGDEAVELLCASFFVGGKGGVGIGGEDEGEGKGRGREVVPCSKERGFALVVKFLKEWMWEAEGLFVPLFGSADSAEGASSAVSSSTTAGTNVWRISTEHDKQGHAWTQSGPDLLVARRVRSLAEATWRCLEGVEAGQLDVRALFTHPTNDYDFLIHIDPAVITRYAHNVNADPNFLVRQGKYANRTKEDEEVGVLPGFDPVLYLFKDLQHIYADTFKIFHDPLGGSVLGCVWDPSLKPSRPFRVLGGFNCSPIDSVKEREKGKDKDKALVVLNQKAIIAEIERLGNGLVERIVVQA